MRTQWPTPEQIGAYLMAHGWRYARPMKQPGTVYAYHRLSDDGRPMELFVPHYLLGVDEIIDFATSVLAVVETIGSFEKLSHEEVFAALLATEVAPTPPAPASVA